MRLLPKGAPSWHIPPLFFFSFFFSSFFLATLVLAKDQPKISVTKFDHPFMVPRYFEDSDVILFHDSDEANVYRSTDAGASWDKLKDVPDGKAGLLVMHSFDPKRAFVLTTGSSHYKTDDRGETWHKFDTPSIPSRFQSEILVFHADDPDRVIYNAMDCEGIFCDEQAFYTTDGFKNTKTLRSFTNGCWWVKASAEFTTGDADLDKNRILCIVKDPLSLFLEDQRLVVSDEFFAMSDKVIQEFEPDMDTNKGVAGVSSVAFVKRYLLVATSSFRSDEMALFVSDDTLKWHRAMFPTSDNHDHDHRISQEAYTVLESTNYSIQIDVMTSQPARPMGVIFTSNSNGTYFTENVPYTNRHRNGLVDFEKITGIQGIFLINTVKNGVEVNKERADKVVITQISFDDGRTFEPIMAAGEKLHLHSVTAIDNIGRIFSSPAPGLVLGNGNTGDSLGKFSDANLYVSDNAGLTWKQARKGPHKYEFGDSGSILVAVRDSDDEDISEFSYSLNRGEDWTSVPLPKKLKIKPVLLTTTQDSTSLKFLLVGQHGKTYQVLAIDFGALGKRTCEDKDMEDWHARADADGKPSCIMGHKQTFRRRKKSADCFVKSDFKDPVPKTEDCDCTDADFECDYNFQRDDSDRSKCSRVGPVAIPEDECKDKDKSGTFMGSPGWRLIPGNTCKRKAGDQKDDPVELKCSENSVSGPTQPANGEVSSKEHVFEAELNDFQKVYLDRSAASTSDDETVIVRPVEEEGLGHFKVEQKLWLTRNHGKDWTRILEGETIQSIYPHPNFQDVVYFTTDGKKVIYTIDRGQNFHTFNAPMLAEEGSLPLSFHPDNKDWLIWVGKNCEKIGGKETCVKEASLSTDRGDTWDGTILRYVEKCEFTGRSAFTFRPLKQIVCLAREKESSDAPLTVISSDDFFSEDKFVFKDPVTNFATMSEFILLASEDKETGDMHALASLDGKHYERAHYPYNFREGHKNEYTVLDSSTHAVNLFVRAEGGSDKLYGSIIKSNSNGTSYVLSAANVNCNEQTFVDFERVAGLEGVTLINVVSNADSTGGEKPKKEKKQLQTKISHNDGSEWGFLPPPAKDRDGKAYSCGSSKGDGSCALHLHHYTERDDKRKTFGADTAIGLLFGVGNVGPHLGDFKDADTFMSTDAGISWKNVKKGRWTWQYGDQGSIIVLVQKATPKNAVKTDIVSYSVDEGNTWKDYKFTDEEVTVLDITTVRSGTSRNFLLWCRSSRGKLFSVNLDFTGLTDKPCKYDKDGDSDYYLWSPKHPLLDNDCLFGHVSRYLRKKTDRKCYNTQDIQRNVENENCECGRSDYECDFNYELDNHGQCKLVQGLKPISGEEWCSKNPNETSYFEPTGYRRVPLSTCQGGSELDRASTEHACTGHEDEFERKHRASGVAVFFAVVLPFAAAAAVGWYVWRHWDGKFGQIRLGENASHFDSDRPWIKYPVIAVSAAAAVVAALPLLAASLWHLAAHALGRGAGHYRGRFTTRDSFARGRGDYSIVDDEGELLGEESDEEV
ncbi:Vacuolar protein sorting/targeting protein 10 [Escovopsis weberi]|uniref:Vacuolar protein sorting/targeting protein 10 n=1 Tax=Escovopsis weberi TaxID=150374 RepID=A0A0M9VRP7_ESCWE|nr:Vacuolar protein sorting/targeting protein 10 [Escovopsis weberi]